MVSCPPVPAYGMERGAGVTRREFFGSQIAGSTLSRWQQPNSQDPIHQHRRSRTRCFSCANDLAGNANEGLYIVRLRPALYSWRR